jgi:RNA polymerase sigma-70 factor (ECF subfamily)
MLRLSGKSLHEERRRIILNDKTIMAALKQDDELWYSMLIDHYAPYVTAIISGIAKGTLSSSDIEEVAADVFFKIWLKRKQVRADSMKAFIAQVTRNASIDRLRKTNKEFLPYDDDIFHITSYEHLDELAIARERKTIMQNAVNSFGEQDREIFIRYYYFGETIKTISNRLHLNTSTTKTKLHRLRSKLKAIMQERGYSCV